MTPSAVVVKLPWSVVDAANVLVVAGGIVVTDVTAGVVVSREGVVV